MDKNIKLKTVILYFILICFFFVGFNVNADSVGKCTYTISNSGTSAMNTDGSYNVFHAVVVFDVQENRRMVFNSTESNGVNAFYGIDESKHEDKTLNISAAGKRMIASKNGDSYSCPSFKYSYNLSRSTFSVGSGSRTSAPGSFSLNENYQSKEAKVDGDRISDVKTDSDTNEINGKTYDTSTGTFINDEIENGPELPFINIDTSEINCDALAPILDDIQMVYDYAKILVVVLLILFCSIDFSKAVMSQDNDLLKKATNSAIKRGIAAILFLFLPTLINLIFPYAGPEFENPLCGIQWVVMFNI